MKIYYRVDETGFVLYSLNGKDWYLMQEDFDV